MTVKARCCGNFQAAAQFEYSYTCMSSEPRQRENFSTNPRANREGRLALSEILKEYGSVACLWAVFEQQQLILRRNVVFEYPNPAVPEKVLVLHIFYSPVYFTRTAPPSAYCREEALMKSQKAD